MTKELKIVVGLVTFNRLDKLKITLECYEKQTLKPQKIIIVDNCSTDGTIEYLKQWEKTSSEYEREVVYLQENTGGAGGFHSVMSRCLKEIETGIVDAEWIYVSDDDAFPEKDALRKLSDFYLQCDEKMQNEIAALCTSVINKGKIHTAHRSVITKSFLRVRFSGAPESLYDSKYFDLDLLSYVGSMIKIDVLKKIGVTKKELFIYGDDNEHSFRIKQCGRIICVPGSIVHHDTQGVETRKVGWHNYYNRRNQLYILKTYFPKRYYYMRLLKRVIKDASVFSKYNSEEKKIFKAAHHDAYYNKLGVHKIYKPGFKL